MVKLTGPGLAKAASGTLGDQLIFSNWKGKAYLKKHARPKQPNSEKQLAMRAMMRFLSQEWTNIIDLYKETWEPPALAADISPFNVYQRENLARWRNFQTPGQVFPVEDTGTPSGYASRTITCLGNHAKLRVQLGSQNDGWGVNFFRSSEGATPTRWDQLVHIMHATGGAWHEWDFYPPTAGTYYFAWNRFSNGGVTSGAPAAFPTPCTLTT